MIKQEYLQAVYDWAFDTAQSIASKGMQVEPVVLSCRFINGKLRSGKIIKFQDFSTVEHKDQAARFMKSLIDRPQVDVVCFLTEAWYVGPASLKEAEATQHDLDEARRCLEEGITPSQHPERRECVIFNFYTKLYDCIAMCPLERPSNKLLRQPLDLTMGHASGRFVRERIE